MTWPRPVALVSADTMGRDAATGGGWDWRHSTEAAELEILPHGTVTVMPFALAGLIMAGGGLASFVPGLPIVVRLAVWAAVIAVATEIYRTSARRIALHQDVVDVELARTSTRIPYASLDHVIVRARRRSIDVTFVVKHPASVIRTRTGLMARDVRAIAPRLIRALIVHGVEVRVPGRPDLGTMG